MDSATGRKSEMNSSAGDSSTEAQRGIIDQPVDQTKAKYTLVGIDFGTTFSGVSWALTSDTNFHVPQTWAPRHGSKEPFQWLPRQGTLWTQHRSEIISHYRQLNRQFFEETLQTPSDTNGQKRTSNFSSGSKQYFIEGHLGQTPLKAFPDSGADMCFISPSMASDLGLEVTPGTGRTIHLANKKPVESPGSVRVPWRFAGELYAHMLECWILPGCVHSLVLGNKFLRATQTLTKFASRIKSKIVGLPKRLRLRLLGEDKQRLWGCLDGHLTAALPDTGSDVMLISRDYAERIGQVIDGGCENWLEVEYADGSTAWTSGVVRDVPWTVGGKRVRCDFHVLDDLCVDVVLSNDYLFETCAFSEHRDCFFDTDSQEDLFQLCNIRLIGRFSDTLSGLEDEYLVDVTSPSAFDPELVQRELARRDQIRDEIIALPDPQREAASQAEAERQRRWQALRDAHRLRWAAGGSEESSSSITREPAHRTVADEGRLRNSSRAATGEVTQSGPRYRPGRGTWWKKKVNVSIPLRYLRPSERVP